VAEATEVECRLGLIEPETPRHAIQHEAQPAQPSVGGSRDQHHQLDCLTGSGQRAGDLVGGEPTIAIAAEHVRAVRLSRPDRRQVLGRHRLDRRRDRPVVQAKRVDREERLVRAEVTGEVPAVEAATVDVAVEEEERPAGPLGLQLEHRREKARAVGVQQRAAQTLHGRVRVERGERQTLPQVLLDPVHHPHRGQRVTAEREEVVPHPDRTHPEELLPQSDQPGLERIARGQAIGRWPRRGAGTERGEGEVIRLAVRGHRDGRHDHEGGGDHVRGKSVAQERSEVGRTRARAQDEVGDDLARLRGRLPCHHHGLAHVRVLREYDLDLPKLDADAPDLHLRVVAAEEFQQAVLAPPREVSGSVEAGVGGRIERMGDEALGGDAGPIHVAAREPGAAEVELAHDTDRSQMAAAIEDVGLGVCDRRTDRHAAGPGRRWLVHPVAAREGRALGRAVAVDDDDAGQPLERAPHVRDGECLAAGQHLLHTVQGGGRLVDERVEEGGGEPHGRHAVASDDLGQRVRRRRPGREDDASAAVEERPPQLERREIERDRRGEQHRARGVESGVRLAEEQSQDAAVRHRHALGTPGRAGGEHHVGEVVGTGRGAGRLRLGTGRRRVEHHDVQRPAVCTEIDRSAGQQHIDAGVVQHGAHPRPRLSGIEGQVRGVGLQHAQHRDGEVGRAREPHTHDRPAADAVPAQDGRNAIGLPVELGVGDPPLALDERDGLWRASRLERERPVGGGRVRVGRVRPAPFEDPRALDDVEHGQLRQA